MLVPDHTIKLQGPWQFELLNDRSELIGSIKVNIRQAADWAKWSRAFTLQDLNQAVAVTVSRKFNWPELATRPARVELALGLVELAKPDDVKPSVSLDFIILNGQQIPVSSDGQSFRSENLTGSLQGGNHLGLHFTQCVWSGEELCQASLADATAPAIDFVRLDIFEQEIR